MVAALTPTQVKVVERLRGGKRLVRYSGGFWTTNDTKLPGGAAIGTVYSYDYYRHGAPEWSTTIQTVRALERKGVLVRCQLFAREWEDPRVLAPGI